MNPIKIFKKAAKPLHPQDGSTGEHVPTLCDTCWWKIQGTATCEAFPKGIPADILVNAFDHHARYVTEQIDDGGLTYLRNPDA